MNQRFQLLAERVRAAFDGGVPLLFAEDRKARRDDAEAALLELLEAAGTSASDSIPGHDALRKALYEAELVVVNMESRVPEILGPYAGAEEDVVFYERRDSDERGTAPEDCVRVMTRWDAGELTRRNREDGFARGGTS